MVTLSDRQALLSHFANKKIEAWGGLTLSKVTKLESDRLEFKSQAL